MLQACHILHRTDSVNTLISVNKEKRVDVYHHIHSQVLNKPRVMGLNGV